MDLPWKKDQAEPGNSGLEMMLRSLGLTEVIAAARMLASEQSIQKIITFANNLEVLQAKIESWDSRLTELETVWVDMLGRARLAQDDGTASGDLPFPTQQLEPGSGPSDRALSVGPGHVAPTEYRAAV